MRNAQSVVKMIYKNQKTGVTIDIAANVLAHFNIHRQIGRGYEVGGQLFARFPSPYLVTIEKASGPRKNDHRFPLFFKPNAKLEQNEINDYFGRGYHFVGDWHTHPEKHPSPSSEDINTIARIYQKSTHTLNSFILIIVGQAAPPDGLYVGLHSACAIDLCLPISLCEKNEEHRSLFGGSIAITEKALL